MKTKSKGVILGTILGIVIAGAGTLGAIKVLNLKVEKAEDISEKYDYMKLDFSNNFEDVGGVAVTKDNFSKLLEKNNIDSTKVELNESDLKGMYFNHGGLFFNRLSSDKDSYSNTICIKFHEGFDNVRFNFITYNEPVYIIDESGKKVLSSWDCDKSSVMISILDNVNYWDEKEFSLLTNKGKLEEPPVTSILHSVKDYNYTESQKLSTFFITASDSWGTVNNETVNFNSRSILLSVEVWNDEASEDIPTPEESTSTSSASVA